MRLILRFNGAYGQLWQWWSAVLLNLFFWNLNFFHSFALLTFFPSVFMTIFLLDFRCCQPSPYFGLISWGYLLFLCLSMSGVENSQMLKLIYMALCNWRYILILGAGFLVLFFSASLGWVLDYLKNILYLYFFRYFAGILSAMGHAYFGRYFWFTSYTGPVGNHCRTFILLFDCLTSTCNWKELVEDSEMGVSLLYFP